MGKKLIHICIVAAMILSMFTGIIPTPTASASNLGMVSAGATDMDKMKKAGITDWKATIGTYDASTGELIGTLTTVNKPALGTHTVTAPTIAGYTLFGYATQKVRVSTFNHSPEVTFKYRKVSGSYIVKYTDMNGAEFERKRVDKAPYGTYTETAIDVKGYTLQGATTQSITLSDSKKSGTITFKYKPNTTEQTAKPTYTVIYEDMNGAEFKRKTVSAGLNFDHAYTETAIDIDAYEVQGDTTQTVTLTQASPSKTITFKYKPVSKETTVKARYTVIYENENGAEFKRKTVSTGLNFDQAYTETAIEINGYEVSGSDTQTVTLTQASPSETITFKYKPVSKEQVVKPKYTVIYENENGAEFKRKNVTTGMNLDQVYTEKAIEIKGYEVTGDAVKTVILTKDSPSKTITFKYKVKEAVKEKTGTYIVKYVNQQGAEFSRDTERNLPFGDYTVSAKEIVNYQLVGQDSVTFKLSADAPTKTVTFTYEPIKGATVTSGGYSVTYVTDKGIQLNRKTLRGLPLGTYIEEARTFEGFDLVSDLEQSLELTNTKPNGTFKFVYKRTASAESTTGSYTVIYENEKGAEFSRKTEVVPFGTYEETAKEIPNFTPLNATETVTVSKNGKSETIRFTYAPTKKPSVEPTISYTIIYKDANGAEFNRKTVEADYGTYTEKAKEIPHYKVKGDAEKTITLSKDKPSVIITFEYEPIKLSKQKKGSYTVIYESKNGAEFSRKTVKDVDFGTYSEVAKTMKEYTLEGERLKEVKLTEANPTATIYFTYVPKSEIKDIKTGSYTVIYEKADGAEFNRKVVKDKPFGTYYEQAKQIDGYKVVGAATKSVILSQTQASNTVIFKYETKSSTSGSYTVIYEDEKGNELQRVVNDDVEFGEYSVEAPEITGYELQGDKVQKFYVLEEDKDTEIRFTYKYVGKGTGTDGSYTVRYVDKVSGLDLGVVTYNKLRTGTYKVEGANFEGYTLVSNKAQSVTLTKDKPSATIVFEYTPSSNLCLVDFVDTIEFKGSKSTAKVFSKGYHFSVNPSDFKNNKQYKITVTSKEGIYNVKIQEKSGSTWKNISTIKEFMDITLYSDCFEDKVFLKLSSDLVTSSVPHLNNTTEITLKVSRSEQLVYKYNVNPFIDITSNAVVQNFRVRELVYGTTYDSFSPNNYFTRAHMFAIISRGLGLSKNGTTKFKDLKTSVWYYNDVMRLNYVGIVEGDKGKANATGYTTANQLYLMLDRTSKLYGGKGISYDKYFKGYKKNAKIKRIDAVTVMSKVFVDLGIITE